MYLWWEVLLLWVSWKRWVLHSCPDHPQLGLQETHRSDFLWIISNWVINCKTNGIYLRNCSSYLYWCKDNIFIALIFRHTIFKRIIKMVLLTDWQTLLIGMKTASTCNTVLRYVCTVCLFTLYLLQFPRNPWLFYKMLRTIPSLTFLQWIPNCTNTSQKWASYRLNKYPYYFVDVNIDRIDTVPKMFCFPTWMVTERWAHGECTLSKHCMNTC